MVDKNKQGLNLPYLKEDQQTVQELLSAGVHFGHRTQKWHPSMREYIYTERNGVHIIDLVKSIKKFNEAVDALYEYASKGVVMFVGTKLQAKDIVKTAAIRSKSHFVVHRWPGGLLTNYSMAVKSIKKLNEMLRGFREGIENRTKKELLLMKTELVRLFNLYGGLRGLVKAPPSCLIVVDAKKSRIAIKEAYKKSIPVIAMVDTNSSTDMINHVIPSNDDAVGSIRFIIERLADVILITNKGVGVEYEDVDMDSIKQAIKNMAKMVEAKRLQVLERNQAREGRYGRHERRPKVVRVSREQVKKFVKI